MNNEPVAYGMLDKDGGIYDSISPEEHDREEGAYTIPLYTYPVKDLTDEEIMDCIEDKTGYSFNACDEDLLDFARAILKKASEK
jgi:hypothetical protein